MIKFLITVVVLAALVGGLWWSGWLNKIIAMIPMQTPVATETATTTPPVANTQQTPPNDLPTATNDASDSALAQDSAALDAQIKNLGTDSANSSASLSDKPVTQEY
jgi:hypothetical protein